MSTPGSLEAIQARYGSQYEASLLSVPEYVFCEGGFDDTITTPAGNTLSCVVTDSRVAIYDTAQPVYGDRPPERIDQALYKFSADIVTQNDVFIAYSIRNRNPLSATTPDARHPDIHPTALAVRSFDCLAKRWAISGLQACWQASVGGLAIAADNYQMYYANLARHRRRFLPATDSQRKAAAAAAWSGGLAARLGFRQVSYVKTSRREQVVSCLFVP